jgi:hypothetical protein
VAIERNAMGRAIRNALAGVSLLGLAACSSGEPGEVIRTPDERFENLSGFDYEPQYIEVDGLRIHYLDEGPEAAMPVLLLHGEPSWSYLYRTMISAIASAGYRAIAPDLVGFGRSDKLVRKEDYSYQMHAVRPQHSFAPEWLGFSPPRSGPSNRK